MDMELFSAIKIARETVDEKYNDNFTRRMHCPILYFPFTPHKKNKLIVKRNKLHNFIVHH